MDRVFLVLTAVFTLSLSPAQPRPALYPETIRVVLSRQDGAMESVGIGVTFERAAVEAAIAKNGVKLPDPLPPGARTGYAGSARVFLLFEPGRTPDAGYVTVDANANHDLRDDARVQFGAAQQPIFVNVLRRYAGPPEKEVALPYGLSLRLRNGEPSIFFAAGYRMRGEFAAGGQAYVLTLSDYLLRGQFTRGNLTKGTVLHLQAQDAPPERGARLWGHELIALGDELYEVRDCAIDGTSIDLVRNTQPRAAIGRAVPDYRLTDTEGKSFGLHEYRGRYLLLDFWPSWCGPCVAEFETIKQALARYSGQPLSVVGVNLDAGTQVDQAKKIIAQKSLTWRQVVEGRDFFLPVFQQLGRLPENPNAFPLYVIVGPDTTVRYATNSFDKMQRFLETAFAAPPRASEVLFVPLAASRNMKASAPLPADFSVEAADALRRNPALKLPADAGAGARLGQLPNGTALLLRASPERSWALLRVDGDRDFDLAEHAEKEISVLDERPTDLQKAPGVQLTIRYAGGAEAYGEYRFAAVRVPGGEIRLYYSGWQGIFAGSFTVEGGDYEITITDPTSDGLFTKADADSEALLTLRQRAAEGWTVVPAGPRDLRIGAHRYRVSHVHDDGKLVELERQPARPPGG